MHDFNDTLSWYVCFKAIFCFFQNQMNFLSGMSTGFWSLGELKKSAVKTLARWHVFPQHFLFSRTSTSVTITRRKIWRVHESDQTLLPTPSPQLKIRVPLWSRKMFFKSFQKYSEDRMMPMSNFTFAAEFQPLFSTLSLWFTVTGYNSRHQTGRFKAKRSQNAS